MGKTMKTTKTMKISIYLCVYLCIVNISCNSKPANTPLKYKNNYKVSEDVYSRDSTEISKVLTMMLSKHVHPFRPEKQFDFNTEIRINSIIYSPDKLKMIVFVITKNSTDKLLKKENGQLFFYNGNYLYCLRGNKNSPIKVFDYAAFNLTHYYSYKEIKDRLDEHCFIDLGKENKYNVDDVRFWESNDFVQVIKNSESTQIPN